MTDGAEEAWQAYRAQRLEEVQNERRLSRQVRRRDFMAGYAAAKAPKIPPPPRRECEVCVALRTMSPEAQWDVRRALAGTMGERRLAEILTRNGYPTGRRAVATHRREDHP